jgi:hypothetical protein
MWKLNVCSNGDIATVLKFIYIISLPLLQGRESVEWIHLAQDRDK